MTQFCDSKKRAWSVEINVATLKRVKALCQVDLLQILDRKTKLFQRLHDDPILLVDVLCAILRPQAIDLGVSDEEFAEGMLGSGLEAATRAFLEAVADFFPKAAQRDAMKKLVAKTGRLADRLMEHGLGEIDAFDPEKPTIAEILKSAAADAGEESEAEPRGASSGNSPASSASTPTLTACDSSPSWPGAASEASGTAPRT